MTNLARQFSLSIDDYYRRNPCLLVAMIDSRAQDVARRLGIETYGAPEDVSN